MPVLTAQNLRRHIGDRAILDDVSLTIRSGEKLGLVGVNGCGKSTLARILSGVDIAEGGEISKRRGARVVYLDQEPAFPEGASAHQAAAEGLAAWQAAKTRYDAVTAKVEVATNETALAQLLSEQGKASEDLERLGGWDMGHRVDELLLILGIDDPNAPVGTMSGGEKRRVALARVLVDRPDLAILDEPTNHLDVDTIEWLENYLKNDYKGALLLITHDRYVLDAVVDRTLELDNGHLHSYDGGWSTFLEAKADRQAAEARSEANRQNFLRTELEWLRRSPQARSTKQQARVDRANAAIAAGPVAAERTIAPIAFSAARSGKTIVEMRDLSIELGGQTLIRGLDLSVGRRDRIGIVGRNGAGKTTLLRALMGQLAPTGGTLDIGKNTKFAYFDQLRSGLDDTKTIRDNVAPNSEKVTVGGEELDVRSYLGRFSFTVPRQAQLVGVLSGGERARVALARLLLEPANVLLFDEPTNDLDVTTLSALEQFLTSLDAAVLCVTHDRYFLDRVATSVLVFEGDGVVTRYEGAYQAARAGRAAKERAKEAAAAAKASERAAATRAAVPAAQPPARTAKKALTFSEAHELEALPAQIEAAESRAKGLEDTLADPTIYTARAGEVPGLLAALESARQEAETLMDRWATLEAKRESDLS